jgi:pSer/pThr/pTyr-binding forkhead associated (FHA) protein
MALRFLVMGVEATVAGMFRDEVRDGEEIVLGRGDDAHIVLPDPSVSRRHCRVTLNAEGPRLEDLGSRLGTRLNGAALIPAEPVPLREGDEIVLGGFRVVFAGAEREAAGQTRALEAALSAFLDQPEESAGKTFLRIENGPDAGRRIEFPNEGTLRLGRGRECEIRLDDARISRLHARLRVGRDDVWLEDAGSRNGTFVGERRIHKAVRLSRRDQVRLGRVRMRLCRPGASLDLGALLLWRGPRGRRVQWPTLVLLLAGFAGLVAAATW